jgi:hypothetical protein
MNLKKSKIVTVAALAAGLLLTLASCGDKEPSYEDRETVEKETFVAVGNTVLTFASGISAEAYAADTPTGAWLDGCDTPDRNDQFDAYTLRHESAADGNTTFTYLIYYPHGGESLAVSPELLEGESGYVINLTFAPGDGTPGYALCRLSVTLPTDKAPRLRLLTGKDALGVMSTVTEHPIPTAD